MVVFQDQTTFPAMVSDSGKLALAGFLKYEPWARFDEAYMCTLQQILEQVYDVDGCENPEIIADWREVVSSSDGQITHRSNIILYRDGADWAEEENGRYEGIGFILCRQDVDQTKTPYTAKNKLKRLLLVVPDYLIRQVQPEIHFIVFFRFLSATRRLCCYRMLKQLLRLPLRW